MTKKLIQATVPMCPKCYGELVSNRMYNPGHSAWCESCRETIYRAAYLWGHYVPATTIEKLVAEMRTAMRAGEISGNGIVELTPFALSQWIKELEGNGHE